MARVGGRNTLFAWTVGVACAAVIGLLVWLAVPLVPASLAFLGDKVNPPTSGPAAGDGEDAASDEPSECRDLYPDRLWSSLVLSEDAVLSPSTDAPASAAAGFVDALAPSVRFTCAWEGAEGAISTTLAEVPPDAGAIATTALPALGFACETVAGRVRCVLTAGERTETIETGGGVWLSSVQDRWHPTHYATEVAEQVFAD